MPATRSARRSTRRPIGPVVGQYELMLGMPPAADGQLDIVTAVADALEVPAAARRMAGDLSAATGVPMRALPDGSITSAPAADPAPLAPAAEPTGTCSVCRELVAAYDWAAAVYHGPCRGWGRPVLPGTFTV